MKTEILQNYNIFISKYYNMKVNKVINASYILFQFNYTKKMMES